MDSHLVFRSIIRDNLKQKFNLRNDSYVLQRQINKFLATKYQR